MVYIYIYTHTHTHTHNGVLPTREKECDDAIGSNIDEPRAYHTKWDKLEKGRRTPYNIAYMLDPKYDTNKAICETDSQIPDYQEAGEEGKDKVGVWG